MEGDKLRVNFANFSQTSEIKGDKLVEVNTFIQRGSCVMTLVIALKPMEVYLNVSVKLPLLCVPLLDMHSWFQSAEKDQQEDLNKSMRSAGRKLLVVNTLSE